MQKMSVGSLSYQKELDAKKKFLSFPDRIYNPYTPLMRKTDAKYGNALMSERLEIQSLLGGVFWIQKLVMYLGNAWTK